MIVEPAARTIFSASTRLLHAGVADPETDVLRLLRYAANGNGGPELPLLGVPLDETVRARFEEAIELRERRVPVAQIVGSRWFHEIEIEVSSDVLDPRPESELLVDAAVDCSPHTVLDLGTGSGCLLVSILLLCPTAIGTGVDISEGALSVAARNAKKHGVECRTRFLRSNWFSEIEGRFDAIVCNPPYLSEDEYSQTEPELRWEPKLALTPGGDGLQPYRTIAAAAMNHLTERGVLICEVGRFLSRQMIEIFEEHGLFPERFEGGFDDALSYIFVTRKRDRHEALVE